MPFVGRNANGSQEDVSISQGGNILCVRYQASSSFTARYITHRTRNTASPLFLYDWKYAIFDDAAGPVPGNLLSCTEPFIDYSDTEMENQWHTARLRNPVQITSGNWYWIGVWQYQFTNGQDWTVVGIKYEVAWTDPVRRIPVAFPVSNPQRCLSGTSQSTGFSGFSIYAHDYFATGVLSTGGAIISWRNHITSVYVDTSGNLQIYELNEDVPRQLGTQTPTQMFGGDSIGWMHAAVDSTGIIHIVAVCTADQTRDIAYNTFNLGTESFGTWEEISAFDQGAPVSPGCSIDIDGSDIPHILATDTVKFHGATLGLIIYSNRSGGSWATQESVSNNVQQDFSQPHISLALAGDIEAFYYNKDTGDPTYRRRNGSWGTENTYAETAANIGALVIQGDDTITRYHMVGVNIEEDNVDSTIDVNSGAINEMDAGIGRTGPIVVYVDGNQDIAIYDPTTGTNTVIETGTYVRVVCEYEFLLTRGYIDILAENSNNELIWIRYDKSEFHTYVA